MSNEVIRMSKETWLEILQAYRDLSGSTSKIKASELAPLLREWGAGRLITSSTTAVSSDLIYGKTAYSKGKLITGTIADKRKSSIDTLTSVIADNTNSQLSISLSTGGYDWVVNGQSTIKIAYSSLLGAANITSNDIRYGATLFGMAGTYIGNNTGTDTSDATATANDIINGKSAYVNGEKIWGSLLPIHNSAVNFQLQGSVADGILSINYTSDASAYISTGDVSFLGNISVPTLIASNIRSGITILGVDGTFTNVGELATPTAADLVYGKTAYVNGLRIDGMLGSRVGQEWLLSSPRVLVSGTNLVVYPSERAVVDASTPIQIDQESVASAIGLTSSKLVSGVTILGITGEGGTSGGIDTSDATASAAEIINGYTAYVKGIKITGILTTTTNIIYAAAEEQSYITFTDDYLCIRPSRRNLIDDSTAIKVGQNLIASAIGLTSGQIVTGYTVLGIAGSGGAAGGFDTSDATATAQDLVSGKIAYNSLGRITGTTDNQAGVEWSISEGDASRIFYESGYLIVHPSGRAFVDENTSLKYNQSLVASAIGLNPNQIVSGNTILGVTGTASAGLDTSDATATAADILYGTTAYISSGKVTGTMQSKSKSVWEYGDETDMYLVDGYFCFTPSQRALVDKTTQFYLDEGSVALVSGLTPEKLVAGNTVLGIEGTGGGGIDTSDANASAQDILAGRTAYVKGEKITGTLVNYTNSSVNFRFTSYAAMGGTLYLYYSSAAPSILPAGTTATFGASIPQASLVPENIKKGVSIFGVVGTYEPGSTKLATPQITLSDEDNPVFFLDPANYPTSGTIIYTDGNGEVRAENINPNSGEIVIKCGTNFFVSGPVMDIYLDYGDTQDGILVSNTASDYTYLFNVPVTCNNSIVLLEY